ncbi:MAG TPA: VanZ family protein [Oscillospiraceae bacterium]|nr:VanZ family protein [Oscillospiraceae bacterium]
MNSKFYRTISAILWVSAAALIFFLSHQTGEESSKSSGTMLLALEAIFKTEISESFVRTAAHFTEFMVFGFLTINLSFAFKGYLTPFKSVIVGSLYAVTDEVHQIFVPKRACEFSDFLVDTAGVIMGVLIFTLIYIVFTKNRKEREKLR